MINRDTVWLPVGTSTLFCYFCSEKYSHDCVSSHDICLLPCKRYCTPCAVLSLPKVTQEPLNDYKTFFFFFLISTVLQPSVLHNQALADTLITWHLPELLMKNGLSIHWMCCVLLRKAWGASRMKWSFLWSSQSCVVSRACLFSRFTSVLSVYADICSRFTFAF